MIKRLLALDGVMAVCKFRDDGSYVEGYGVLPESELQRLARFALEYKRMVQGNADQLAMFTQMNGWTPPGGWMVRGPQLSACSMSNVVCIFNNNEASVNELMQELRDVANY